MIGGAGLITTALSLWFGGPLQDQHARWMWDDDAEDTVQGLITDLVAAGRATSLEQRQRYVDRARSRTTDKVTDKVWKQWTVGPDPYVWTRVTLDSGDETREKAFVGRVDGEPWALRRAKSGCWELRGDFELVRTRGKWKIKRLPRFHERCRPEVLRATWRGGDSKRGVIAWEGAYQRIDPIEPDYSEPRLLMERVNYKRVWRPQKSYDVGDPVTDDGHLAYDGDLSTAWGATAPAAYDEADPGARSWGTLTYSFPAAVQLLRVRLHNGVELGDSYERHGRIKTATIHAGDRSVDVALKSRIGTQRVDCSFGTVRSVSIDITGVWPRAGSSPAESDVALSHIDFWGMPRNARIDAPPPTGRYAWSDAGHRAEDEEDIAECRDDPPWDVLVADPAPTPTPTPDAVIAVATPEAAAPQPTVTAAPTP